MAKLVIVMMDGGLGNQIGQFVFLRLLEKLYHVNCIVDDSAFWSEGGPVDHNGYELEKVFGIKLPFLSDVFEKEQWLNMLSKRKDGISIPMQLNEAGMQFRFVADCDVNSSYYSGDIIRLNASDSSVFDFLEKIDGNLYFYGYYINSIYWKVVKQFIIGELQFPRIEDVLINHDNNTYYALKIQETNSVAIHIRRGDFITVGRAISASAYQRKVLEVREQYQDAVFFVFSDDMDWCAQNQDLLGLDGLGENLVFVKGNDVSGYQYIDMQLMSMCKQIIMCDSSFSYWAALFNQNSNVKLYRAFDINEETTKRFSIVIPCYNVEKYLEQCLESIINQTIGIDKLEIILVDDCSTDGTVLVMKKYEQMYPDSIMLVLLDENGRQGKARNIGMSYAQGEYLSFVDSDDMIRTDMYEILDKIISENNLDLVQFRYQIFRNDREPKEESISIEDCIKTKELNIYEYASNRQNYLLNSNILNESCTQKVYRRELVEQNELRFMQEVGYEEPLFTYPLKFIVNKMAVLEKELYYYRENLQGTTLSYMSNPSTIVDHLTVQLELRKYMETHFDKSEYEAEKDMYFLHTFLYEPFYFMKKRGSLLPVNLWRYMKKNALIHIPNAIDNEYLSNSSLAEDKMIVELLYVNEDDDERMQAILDATIQKIQV